MVNLFALTKNDELLSPAYPLGVPKISPKGGNMFPPKLLISVTRGENFFRSLPYGNDEAPDTSRRVSFCIGKPHFVDEKPRPHRRQSQRLHFQKRRVPTRGSIRHIEGSFKPHEVIHEGLSKGERLNNLIDRQSVLFRESGLHRESPMHNASVFRHSDVHRKG